MYGKFTYVKGRFYGLPCNRYTNIRPRPHGTPVPFKRLGSSPESPEMSCFRVALLVVFSICGAWCVYNFIVGCLSWGLKGPGGHWRFSELHTEKVGHDLQVEKKCSYTFYYTLTVRCLVKLFVFPHLEGRYEPFEWCCSCIFMNSHETKFERIQRTCVAIYQLLSAQTRT